jgi:hypothetical protein
MTGILRGDRCGRYRYRQQPPRRRAMAWVGCAAAEVGLSGHRRTTVGDAGDRNGLDFGSHPAQAALGLPVSR